MSNNKINLRINVSTQSESSGEGFASTTNSGSKGFGSPSSNRSTSSSHQTSSFSESLVGSLTSLKKESNGTTDSVGQSSLMGGNQNGETSHEPKKQTAPDGSMIGSFSTNTPSTRTTSATTPSTTSSAGSSLTPKPTTTPSGTTSYAGSSLTPKPTTTPSPSVSTYRPSSNYIYKDTDGFHRAASIIGIVMSVFLFIACICVFNATVNVTREGYTGTHTIQWLNQAYYIFAIFLIIFSIIFVITNIVRLVKGGNSLTSIILFAFLSFISMIAMIEFFKIKDHNRYSGEHVSRYVPNGVYNFAGFLFVVIFIGYLAATIISIVRKVQND